MKFRSVLAAGLMAVSLFTATPTARAADHRDAPGVDGAGEGDITDVFAFLNPTNRGRLVLAMGVNPFAIPAAGPTRPPAIAAALGSTSSAAATAAAAPASSAASADRSRTSPIARPAIDDANTTSSPIVAGSGM